MSRITFENYGKTAQREDDPTVLAGRYAIQRRAERLIVMDVARKLDIQPDDRLLEIGCGPGNILIPLSFMVASSVGMDHPAVCRRLRTRFRDDQIRTIGCNFLDYTTAADDAFDKVLIYSVISTLSDQAEAMVFLDKAVTLVAPGGRLLLGDIANADRKRRFLNTEMGHRFEVAWREEMPARVDHDESSDCPPVERTFQPTDRFIRYVLEHYRARGFEVHALSQPSELPFGHTREDILIHRYPD